MISKLEVCILVRDFFIHNIVPQGINAANLLFVPKFTNTEYVSDVQPIGCCNFIYKIIAHILATRLKPICLGIISPNQSAFV